MKNVGLYCLKPRLKFTTGSGTQYGYVGGSLKKCLIGLLKAIAVSFSHCISLGVKRLFFGSGGNKYAFIGPVNILYVVLWILVAGAAVVVGVGGL